LWSICIGGGGWGSGAGAGGARGVLACGTVTCGTAKKIGLKRWEARI